MPFCPQCGVETSGQESFCPECGTPLNKGQTLPPEGQQQTPGRARQQSQNPQHPPPVNQSQQQPTQTSASDDSSFLTRRKFVFGGGGLLAVGAGFLLLGGGTQHAVYGDAWEKVQRQENTSSVTLEGTVELPTGRYGAQFLNPSIPANYEISIDVIDGGAIDLITLPKSEYDRYRDQDRETQFLTGLSELESTSTTVSGAVSAGDYVMILDNTPVFGASPDGDAAVDIEVIASLG